MNLLADCWMPVVRRNGTREKIAIWQLLDDYQSNPVIEIETPRPDFRNAMYQLLIGIIQVAAAPEDEEDWAELWKKPYTPSDFKEKLLAYQDCFEIDSDGPAFMQDYDLPEEGSKEEDLTNLFISLPGNKHYWKRTPKQIDIYWAAIALYTLQTFSPSGGSGHRTGLRGGGPLTTILLPKPESELDEPSLWKKIWLNILNDEQSGSLSGNTSLHSSSDIYPWMKKTKISKENGTGLFPEECHPLQMFFGMPRRIRLRFIKGPGVCKLTNEICQTLVAGYHTRPHGNNYEGIWIHPLNAYGIPQEKEKLPNPIKPQEEGLCYRHWIGLALSKKTQMPALVVQVFVASNYRRMALEQYQVVLWAAGYDMKNMLSRCWYEATMPVYSMSNEHSKIVSERVSALIEQTAKLVASLQRAIKDAWSTSEAKFHTIVATFWQNTEPLFYQLLDRMVKNIDDTAVWAECAKQWQEQICREAYSLFDQWALAQQEDGLDMRRIVHAREGLRKQVYKARKEFANFVETE